MGFCRNLLFRFLLGHGRFFMVETCKNWKKMADQLQVMMYNKTGRVKICNKSFGVT